MNEQFQSSREHITGPGSGGGIFDEPVDAPGQVLVNSGPHSEHLPLANLTVGEIRARFRDRFDIDEQARAVLDGVDVNHDTIVRQGQVLMFTHRAGEKGLGLSSVRGRAPSVIGAGHPPRWRPCAATIPAGRSSAAAGSGASGLSCGRGRQSVLARSQMPPRTGHGH